MFKKTAIAFGLAIVTGSAFAAPAAGTAGADVSANASASGMSASANTNGSLTAQFKKLDTNGNGVLSMSEAQANPAVAKLYNSLKTNESISTDPKAKRSDAKTNGVTLEQFKAGMHAATGGTAGPAVSGGDTYTVMKDGAKKTMEDGAARAKSGMKSAESGAKDAGTATKDRMKTMGASAETRMKDAGQRMKQDGAKMRQDMGSRMDRAKADMAGKTNTMTSGTNGGVQTEANGSANASGGTTQMNGGANADTTTEMNTTDE